MMTMTMGFYPRFNFIARAATGSSEYQTKTMTLLPFTPSNLWDNTGKINNIKLYNCRCQKKS
jgi:hypothetical protein